MIRVLHWAPRIIAILFALFLSLFALDVFGAGSGFRETILAFLIHLVPSYIVIAALVISWKRDLAGAILFGALAATYVILTRGRFHWTAYLAISGPLALTGLLFLLGWIRENRSNSRQ